MVVTATGMVTEVGHTSGMLTEKQDVKTPPVTPGHPPRGGRRRQVLRVARHGAGEPHIPADVPDRDVRGVDIGSKPGSLSTAARTSLVLLTGSLPICLIFPGG